MAIDYCRHLRENGELMAIGAARDMDAHVPTCPEWNVGKLVTHTGLHHRWVGNAVRGKGEPPEDPQKPGLRGDPLLEWLRAGFHELADLLDHTDDAQPAWTWSVEQNAGFWRRRTALETLVHRWDAENATGATTPMDVELAADCADEMLYIFVPRAGDDAIYKGPTGTASLRTIDHPAGWNLRLEEGVVPHIERDTESDADATVRARAEDLGLMLWGRLGPEVLDIEGDESIREAFVAWLTS